MFILFVRACILFFTGELKKKKQDLDDAILSLSLSCCVYFKIKGRKRHAHTMLRRLLIEPFVLSSRLVSQYYSKKKILVPSRLG